MHRFALLAALLSGCFHHGSSRPIEGAVLGRVVVYRNGVAFYERHATAIDGKLSVRVPRERVDDFLKSLTVVDPATRRPLAVSIPRTERDDGSGRDRYLTMTLEASDHRPTDVLLTYITEAPAWKPSYRAVIDPHGKVMLEGWAVVDNMSGEDWKGVLVGVGASSALSFRYDLWSVRRIDRDLLQGDETFAVAPPTGLSPYPEGSGAEELGQIDESSGATPSSQGDGLGVSFAGSTSLENQYYVDGVNTTGLTYGSAGSSSSPPAAPTTGAIQGVVKDKRSGESLAGVTVVATSPKLSQSETAITDNTGFYKLGELPPGDYNVTFYFADLSVEHSGVHVGVNKVSSVYQVLDQSKAGGETIHVAAKAPTIDPTSTTQSITIDKQYKNIPVPGRTFETALGAAAGSQSDGLGASDADRAVAHLKQLQKQETDQLHAAASKAIASKKDILIEVHGATETDASARAIKARDKLVDEGVPAKRIHVSPKIGPSESRTLRLLAVAPMAPGDTQHAPPSASARGNQPDTPVGESHFIADKPMTVHNGSSAMVAMVHGETDGGVVYLYDPISDRGDKRFAFKAVRLVNPTDDTLEPGPMTVYGDGRFIGEGITEPVPPRASVVIPFALDRQVVIKREDDEKEQIARLVTVQRGTITAEVQHRREAHFTVTSRLAEPTTVYLRHRLESGWTLVEPHGDFLKVGDAQLFAVKLGAGETKQVTIAEATPIERSLDLSSDQTLDMMKVFVEEPNASPKLKEQVEALFVTHHSAADIVDKIRTLREQLVDIQAREGELHSQIVTLRMVRAGGELMQTLRTKLAEMSDRAQKTTIAIVDAQEQLMLARVKFQNQLTELHLSDATAVSKK
jgi:hypothetical protein